MYARRKEYALSYLGGTCQECGSSESLQVDHVNPGHKRFDLFGSRWSCQWQSWHDELEKCQLLCVECHKSKTSADRTSRPPDTEEPPF